MLVHYHRTHASTTPSSLNRRASAVRVDPLASLLFVTCAALVATLRVRTTAIQRVPSALLVIHLLRPLFADWLNPATCAKSITKLCFNATIAIISTTFPPPTKLP